MTCPPPRSRVVSDVRTSSSCPLVRSISRLGAVHPPEVLEVADAALVEHDAADRQPCRRAGGGRGSRRRSRGLRRRGGRTGLAGGGLSECVDAVAASTTSAVVSDRERVMVIRYPRRPRCDHRPPDHVQPWPTIPTTPSPASARSSRARPPVPRSIPPRCRSPPRRRRPPSVRMVLLQGPGRARLRFYTNYESRKGARDRGEPARGADASTGRR